MDKMNPKEITTHNTFVNLFPIKNEVPAKIEEHIKGNQYLTSHPLTLATWEGQKEPVCIDGHTRLQAAINVGLDQVPVFTHELDTEGEALQLAIHLQQNRRNMTDAEIVTCIQIVDSRKQRGGDRRSEEAKSRPQHFGNESSRSSSAKKTAELVGVSARKVEQVRTITDHGGEEIVESVKNGDMSINKACQETRKKRRATKARAKGSELEADRAGRESKNGSGESHGEKSTNVAQASVTLIPEHYRALRDLGESLEYHVELDIDIYLRMVADEFENDNTEGHTVIIPEDS